MVIRGVGGALPYFCRPLARQLAIFLFCGFTLALGVGHLPLVCRDLLGRQRPPDVPPATCF
jgi:hypothetical protein